jgi:hypothetical protein
MSRSLWRSIGLREWTARREQVAGERWIRFEEADCKSLAREGERTWYGKLQSVPADFVVADGWHFE